MNKARFWDKIAEKYAATPLSDPDAYERKLAMTRAYFDPHSKLLEIGCGTGSTSIAHAPYVAQIRALDISPEMTRIAKEKAAAAGMRNISFGVADIEETRDFGGPYDVIMAHSVLHLMETWQDVLTRVAASLKPGGVLVSSTMCMSDHYGMLRYILPSRVPFGLVPKVVFMSESDLVGAHRALGLEIVENWTPAPKTATFLIARKPSA